MKETQITIYKSLFDPKLGDFQVSLEKVLNRIKNGSSRNLLEKIRVESDKEQRNELKKNLPCILFAGTFSARKDDSLIKSSGICSLDFDDFKDICNHAVEHKSQHVIA